MPLTETPASTKLEAQFFAVGSGHKDAAGPLTGRALKKAAGTGTPTPTPIKVAALGKAAPQAGAIAPAGSTLMEKRTQLVLKETTRRVLLANATATTNSEAEARLEAQRKLVEARKAAATATNLSANPASSKIFLPVFGSFDMSVFGTAPAPNVPTPNEETSSSFASFFSLSPAPPPKDSGRARGTNL